MPSSIGIVLVAALACSIVADTRSVVGQRIVVPLYAPDPGGHSDPDQKLRNVAQIRLDVSRSSMETRRVQFVASVVTLTLTANPQQCPSNVTAKTTRSIC
jgi:hypothetical protein